MKTGFIIFSIIYSLGFFGVIVASDDTAKNVIKHINNRVTLKQGIIIKVKKEISKTAILYSA